MVFRGLLSYNKDKVNEETMSELRSALIQATIKEGAANPSNKRFSTKTIAENCGVWVSFHAFSTLFKPKTPLVEEAL